MKFVRADTAIITIMFIIEGMTENAIVKLLTTDYIYIYFDVGREQKLS